MSLTAGGIVTISYPFFGLQISYLPQIPNVILERYRFSGSSFDGTEEGLVCGGVEFYWNLDGSNFAEIKFNFKKNTNDLFSLNFHSQFIDGLVSTNPNYGSTNLIASGGELIQANNNLIGASIGFKIAGQLFRGILPLRLTPEEAVGQIVEESTIFYLTIEATEYFSFGGTYNTSTGEPL